MHPDPRCSLSPLFVYDAEKKACVYDPEAGEGECVQPGEYNRDTQECTWPKELNLMMFDMITKKDFFL